MEEFCDKPRLLWVDLRIMRSVRPSPDLSDLCEQRTESMIACIDDKIRHHNPQILCFDYDFPNAERLRTLEQTKHQFPSLPILMFTLQHSEALAIWAFRSGVRDFIVKPVEKEFVVRRVAALINPRMGRNGAPRYNLLPHEPVPLETRFVEPNASEHVTSAALAFIETHLHEPISLAAMAELCDVSRFQFCRIFKSENGMSFRNYLVHRRIERAKDLLLHPHASVSDVAFTVGFNDPSHFTRMFNRYVGCAPSQFRMIRIRQNVI